MISLSGTSEAGKSIVEHSGRAQAASTVESTALRSGFGEARRGYRERSATYKIPSYKEIDRNLIVNRDRCVGLDDGVAMIRGELRDIQSR